MNEQDEPNLSHRVNNSSASAPFVTSNQFNQAKKRIDCERNMMHGARFCDRIYVRVKHHQD